MAHLTFPSAVKLSEKNCALKFGQKSAVFVPEGGLSHAAVGILAHSSMKEPVSVFHPLLYFGVISLVNVRVSQSHSGTVQRSLWKCQCSV